MKKSLVLALVAVGVFAIASFAQWSEAVQDVKLYWQPDPKTVVFNPACTYLYQRPDIDTAAVVKAWMKDHTTPDGSIIRPTSIGIEAMPLLDVYFGDNDLIAFWHQITEYGPIKDILTLSKIMTISVTRVNPETGGYPDPSWTCSLGEVLTIIPWFNLKMGTADGQLPDRYQQ